MEERGLAKATAMLKKTKKYLEVLHCSCVSEYQTCVPSIDPLEPRKNPLTFHYTGCLTGLLIMAYSNPHITGSYNSLYTLNNEGFFHGSLVI